MNNADKLEYIETKRLIPSPNNARTHSDNQVSQIRDSIHEFGFLNPVLIDDEMRIIAGHGRVLAAQQEGMETVPCIRISHLTDAQKRAYMLADNQIALNAGWDMDLLRIELEELENCGFDLDLAGFDPEMLSEVFPSSGEVKDDGYEVVLPETPTSQRGDLYQLGTHRLLCGDCTDENDVSKLMGSDKASLIWTDPPWNVDYGSGTNPKWKNGTDRQILNDSMDTESFRDFLSQAFTNFARYALPGCMAYVVMSAQEWGSLMHVMRDTGFHWSSTIIWNKNKHVLSRKDYHTKYEPVWYGWQQDGPRLCPLIDRLQSDVWDIDRPQDSPEHPTMKPIELVGRAIQNSSKTGDTVADFFGGSGTTLIACEQLGRECRMMELDPKYADVIIHRWETLTGQKAVKING